MTAPYLCYGCKRMTAVHGARLCVPCGERELASVGSDNGLVPERDTETADLFAPNSVTGGQQFGA